MKPVCILVHHNMCTATRMHTANAAESGNTIEAPEGRVVEEAPVVLEGIEPEVAQLVTECHKLTPLAETGPLQPETARERNKLLFPFSFNKPVSENWFVRVLHNASLYAWNVRLPKRHESLHDPAPEFKLSNKQLPDKIILRQNYLGYLK